MKIRLKSEGSHVTPSGKLEEDLTMIIDITVREEKIVEYINVTLEIPK